MDLKSIDARYSAFRITYMSKVDGVTVPADNPEATKPYSTHAHQTLVRLNDRIYIKDLDSKDEQWFADGYTVTRTVNSGGEGLLVVTTGDDAPFDPNLGLYEPQAGPCLPFATGLTRVKWRPGGSISQKGLLETFQVDGEFNADGYPIHLNVTPGPGFVHEYSYDDFRPVEGEQVPFHAHLETKSRLWKKADFNTEELEFLSPNDALPSYGWSGIAKVSDNRSGTPITVRSESLIKFNGGKAPETTAELLAALDRIRPTALKQLQQIEAKYEQKQASNLLTSPIAIGIVSAPVLVLVATFWWSKQKKQTT